MLRVIKTKYLAGIELAMDGNLYLSSSHCNSLCFGMELRMESALSLIVEIGEGIGEEIAR